MTTTRKLVLGAAALLVLITGCSAQSNPASPRAATASSAAGSGLAKVVLLGDSIAVGEALPLAAAARASGVAFESIAEDGGGNVVGPFADQNWQQLPAKLASAHATVLVYQLTTYDWGSQQQQQAAYQRLLTTVTGTGARLVFVTAPPIRPDDFYQPHLADLAHAPAAAQAVAAASAGRATVLDASAVWGATYQQFRDGKADRSADGIHTCPQGAARFTNWLLGRLATLFPGFTPAAPQTWANTGWSADPHFTDC